MSGSLFSRLGIWVLAAGAAGLLVYPRGLPDAVEASDSAMEAPAMKLVIAGVALLAIGAAADWSARSRTSPCRTCGAKSIPGSIFCLAHKSELAAAAGRAGAQRRTW